MPESAPADRVGNRSNYMTWGMFTLPGAPDEISVYATEAYYVKFPRVRRFTYRLDGFVSLRAEDQSGRKSTKPLAWSGNPTLNAAVENGGSLRVELQQEDGKRPLRDSRSQTVIHSSAMTPPQRSPGVVAAT